ncbi:MAG: fibronectin type III domain-containing protein [Deltaproteobacteria bacterium]|nr:MAG: fibronectin type III domain-containing protein [Deltaproteobacteria bacterium]
MILLAVAGSAESSEPEPTTSTGVKVTKSVPFAMESIDEIRAAAPFRENTAPKNRAIHVHPNPRGSGAGRPSGLSSAGPSVAAPFLASTPAPSAPALISGFAGLGNLHHSEGDVVPPDTMGAVGPDHLVSLLNSEFGVFDRAGTLLRKVSLESFWGSLVTPPGEPADFPFDTKILYDQHSSRFVAVTLDCTVAPNSWVMLGVSATDNALGDWYKWAIDADRDNDQQLSLNWADFPGLGLDGDNLYISTNMFSNANQFRYSKVWVLSKAQLLSGASSITWTEFPAPAGSSFNMQPAHTFGAATAEYFLFEGSSTHLLMARIDNTAGTPVWHAPTAVPAAYPFLDDLPQAPQAGSDRTIHTSDPRLLNVVYRNGSLWTVHAVQSPATVKTEIAWYRINPAAGTVLAEGRVSDPVRWYYYPSIGVNQDDVAAIGFSGSSSREYVGGYYTIVRPTTGVAEAVSLLKAGEAPYYKTLGGTRNRWGDYSATVVDPTDDVTFWTLQEYAQTPDNVTGGSRWGTWWGGFRPSDVASPSGLSATAGTGVQVSLTWTDSSANELGFRIERRRLPAGAYSVIATAGANTTSFADNTDTGLAASASYHYRVESYNAGGGAYSNEAYVTTSDAPPPPAGDGGGGGGGCLSITRSGGVAPDATSFVAVGILLLPAFLLGLRRFSRRRKQTVPIRHPLC